MIKVKCFIFLKLSPKNTEHLKEVKEDGWIGSDYLSINIDKYI